MAAINYTESHFGLVQMENGRLSADDGKTVIRRNVNREQLKTDILNWMGKDNFQGTEEADLDQLLDWNAET